MQNAFLTKYKRVEFVKKEVDLNKPRWESFKINIEFLAAD